MKCGSRRLWVLWTVVVSSAGWAVPVAVPGEDPELPSISRNLLRNPDFEIRWGDSTHGTEAWGWSAGASVVEGEEAHSGRRCVKIEGPGYVNNARALIPVRPGKKYEVKLWAKASGPDTQEKGVSVRAVVYWLGPDKKLAPSAKQAVVATCPDSNFPWREFRAQVTAPAGAALARFALVNPRKEGTVWYDNLRFVETIRATASFRPVPVKKQPWQPPVAVAGPCGEPPSIDGNLDDACWKDCASARLVEATMGHRVADALATDALVTYDDRALYAAFRCCETQMDKIVSQPRERDDDGIRDDECVHVFLRPPTGLYHIIVNPSQAILDRKGGNSSWNGNIEVAASRAEGMWCAELAIPFVSLGADAAKVGRSWKANFARERQKPVSRHVKKQVSIWTTKTGPRFVHLENFGLGVLKFADAPGKTVGIRGAIRVEGGPLEGIQVAAGGMTYITQPDGTFELDGLGPGKHVVTLTAPRIHPMAGEIQLAKATTTILPPVVKARNPHQFTFDLAKPGQEYLVYVSNYLDCANPNISPKEEDLGTKLGAFATPGEYEPVSFTLYAFEDLGKVAVSLSDLEGPQGKILKENLDLRTVRVIFRRTVHQSNSTVNLRPMPEVLDNYEPFEMPKRTFRQFWLTIHVPESAQPGKYQGTVRISPQNASPKELSLTVEVLPIRLRRSPEKRLGIYPGRSKLSEAECRDMQEHGVEIVTASARARVLERDGKTVLDCSAAEEALRKVKAAGFAGPVPLHISVHPDVVNEQTGKKVRRLTEEQMHSFYVEHVRNVKELAERSDLPPVLFYPADEPFGEKERFEKYLREARWIKEVPGARVYVTTFGATVDRMQEKEIDDVTDVRCYHGWTTDGRDLGRKHGPYDFAKLAAQLRQSGDEAWFYYNKKWSYDHGQAEFSRLLNGFYLWLTPYRVHIPWCYMHWRGDPYDATDGTELGSHAYRSPVDGSIVSTVQWEAFREGFDDIRYLYTLKALIHDARQSGKAKDEADQAEGVLAEIRRELETHGPAAPELMEYLDAEKYQDYRRRIADQILRLQSSLED